MQTTDDIIFESRDIEIFNIPDTKTKLNTLQNYFFPRLQRLLDMALLLIKEVYKVDPLEKYTFVYRPAHRKDAKANWDYNDIHIGIAGRRRPGSKLKIRKADGSNYVLHPSYLFFKVLPTGDIHVELSPFHLRVANVYVQSVKQFLIENHRAFSVIMNSGKFFYEGGDDFEPIVDRLKDKNDFRLSSPNHYFPIDNQAVIYELILSFALLFPILDACYDIAEGTPPTFITHLENFKTWLVNAEDQGHEEDEQIDMIQRLPELDSYKFVRAGLWYQVLMKDNWTCCSCKRSAKEHGIVLHIDHIKPRSLGGKDELENLQTLCQKCNLGKSNKDTTDLRS